MTVKPEQLTELESTVEPGTVACKCEHDVSLTFDGGRCGVGVVRCRSLVQLQNHQTQPQIRELQSDNPRLIPSLRSRALIKRPQFTSRGKRVRECRRAMREPQYTSRFTAHNLHRAVLLSQRSTVYVSV